MTERLVIIGISKGKGAKQVTTQNAQTTVADAAQALVDRGLYDSVVLAAIDLMNDAASKGKDDDNMFADD